MKCAPKDLVKTHKWMGCLIESEDPLGSQLEPGPLSWEAEVGCIRSVAPGLPKVPEGVITVHLAYQDSQFSDIHWDPRLLDSQWLEVQAKDFREDNQTRGLNLEVREATQGGSQRVGLLNSGTWTNWMTWVQL